jgi:hypothetical protein
MTAIQAKAAATSRIPEAVLQPNAEWAQVRLF